MALFNGRTIVIMPSSPAPVDVQFTRNSIVAVNESIFTGQQQIQDWGGSWYDATLTFATMSAVDGLIWRDFLLSLNGPANVFAFSNATLISTISTLAAKVTPSGYWCLKDPITKWLIKTGMVYGGLTIDCREAK